MIRTRSTATRRLAVVALAAFGVILSGCADNGSSSKPTTGADAMTLNVGQTSNSVAFFPLFVAEDQGYFKAEGLALGDRPRMGTGAKLAAALQAGSIDVAAGVMTDVFNLYKINPKTKLLGSLVNEYYVDIIAGPSIPAALDQTPLAERVKGLKGKKIGITGPGSGTEALVVYLLKQQGLDAKTDVTLVNLGSDASASIGALKAHRVDALSFFQPIGQQAEATGVGRIYISPARGDVPELTGITHGAVFTTQPTIDRKGNAVAAFLRAIASAEKTITDDPAKAKILMQKYQETINPTALEAFMPVLAKEIPSTPTLPEEAYQKSATFHQNSGLLTEAPAYGSLVPSAWVAAALADKG